MQFLFIYIFSTINISNLLEITDITYGFIKNHSILTIHNHHVILSILYGNFLFLKFTSTLKKEY